jgi:hypothetical protein
MRGSNGTPNGNYYVLNSTNARLPIGLRTVLATNLFDASGNFAVTNAVSPSVPASFFRVQAW